LGGAKRAWNPEEDNQLRALVQGCSPNNIKWKEVALALGTKTGKQCRERWYNQLQVRNFSLFYPILLI
jgi:myb proto-oncogene protein